MATYTENINLKKPSEEDFFNIQDFNTNADIIDAEFAKSIKVPVDAVDGNFVCFDSNGQIQDSGKSRWDFMSATANYISVGADKIGSSAEVREMLTRHMFEGSVHFDTTEKEKLAIALTTDDIVISAEEPPLQDGRIWIKIE